MNITVLEKQMIEKMVRDYLTPINGAYPKSVEDATTWADSVIESHSDGGVFSSLVKKGLAWHTGEIVDKKTGRLVKDSDAGVCLTVHGFEIFKQLFPTEESWKK